MWSYLGPQGVPRYGFDCVLVKQIANNKMGYLPRPVDPKSSQTKNNVQDIGPKQVKQNNNVQDMGQRTRQDRTGQGTVYRSQESGQRTEKTWQDRTGQDKTGERIGRDRTADRPEDRTEARSQKSLFPIHWAIADYLLCIIQRNTQRNAPIPI